MKEWMSNIRKVVPYVPGEQPKMANIIKLNTNENPYPPTRMVAEESVQFNTELLRLYPDPTVSDLVEAIADNYGLSPEQIFVGVGSDDVLATAFLTFFASNKPIFFPDITYSFYDVWADLFRIPYKTIPLDENFHIRPEDYIPENGGVVIANPNAPTSIYVENDQLEKIIQANSDCIVIIDEAYVDFAPASALPLLEKYDNLVIVQTFSKSRSMAGMRIGYAMASPELIKAMNDVKYSYNSYTMNMTSIRYGVAAIKDQDYFKETVSKIVATREHAKIRLKELGFSFPDSQTNFLFATHETKSAEEIFEELKKRGIFVRYFKKPLIDNYLRITIGTDDQMESLYKALKEIL